MVVTPRDDEVIMFLRQFGAATTSTLNTLFFGNLRYTQRRLKKLYQHKLISRDRDIVSEYYYYLQKPKQLRHQLVLTGFYREVCGVVKVDRFLGATTLGSIRPDGIMAYRVGKSQYVACIEVETSNNGFNANKYLKWKETKEYTKYGFSAFPLVVVISSRSVPTQKQFKVIHIKPHFRDIRKLLTP